VDAAAGAQCPPAAPFDPKLPSFSPKISDLGTLQSCRAHRRGNREIHIYMWNFIHNNTPVAWLRSQGRSRRCTAEASCGCCQWVLTRHRNSCRPPRVFARRLRRLPQLRFTLAPLLSAGKFRIWGGVWGAPHVRFPGQHLNNVSWWQLLVPGSPGGWALFKHLGFGPFWVGFFPLCSNPGQLH